MKLGWVNNSTTGSGRSMHGKYSILETIQPTKIAIRVLHTCLTVTVYELSVVLDPSIHDVFCPVESGEPPTV